MNIAAKARAAAMGFEVKKDAVRQVQCGDWRLTLTVAAADMPVRVITAPPGVRYMLALVEIGDDEQPVSVPSEDPGTSARDLRPASPSNAEPLTPGKAGEQPRVAPKREPPQRCPTAAPDPLVTYVCMSCGVPRFQAWLKSYVDLSGDLDHQGAIHCVRQLLGVKSRGEIATNPVARQKALALMADYDVAMGRVAEDRS